MSAAHPMAFAFVTYFFALAYSHSFQRVAIIIGKISPVCKSGFSANGVKESCKITVTSEKQKALESYRQWLSYHTSVMTC
jgi:hypothetical protein